MKKNYVSPDLTIESFVIKDVILSSIINGDESYQGGGVVIIDPEEELDN